MSSIAPSTPTYERFLMGKNSNFIKLFQDGRDADVILQCGTTDSPIRCHKFMLALHSPVFASILNMELAKSTSTTDNSKITINLPEDNAEIMQILIGFFYFDQELQCYAVAMELIQMAHKYDCPHIVSFCSSYIQTKLTLQNVLDVHQVSRLINCSELIAASKNLIKAKISLLIITPAFLNMDRTKFIQFLDNDGWKFRLGFLATFECIYNWIKAECQRNGKGERNEVAHAIRPLLKYVDFTSMNVQNFTGHVLRKNILTLEETIEIYKFYSNNKTLIPAHPVLLDICDLIGANYSRRLLSIHSFKYEGSSSVHMNEVQFTYDETCSHKDNNKQVLVGVRVDGVERFYTNDAENPLVVRFEPEITIPQGKFIDIFWSDKYEFTDFSEFSTKDSSYSIPDNRVRSSTGHVWIFRSFNQNQLDRSNCPLKFLRFL